MGSINRSSGEMSFGKRTSMSRRQLRRVRAAVREVLPVTPSLGLKERILSEARRLRRDRSRSDANQGDP
jgi:hypothetical protein